MSLVPTDPRKRLALVHEVIAAGDALMTAAASSDVERLCLVARHRLNLASGEAHPAVIANGAAYAEYVQAHKRIGQDLPSNEAMGRCFCAHEFTIQLGFLLFDSYYGERIGRSHKIWFSPPSSIKAAMVKDEQARAAIEEAASKVEALLHKAIARLNDFPSGDWQELYDILHDMIDREAEGVNTDRGR